MKKHAVLIGINNYKRLGQLRYARQDAQAVADALKRCYGFSSDEITLMTDESKNPPEDRFTIEDALSPDYYKSDLDLFVFGFFGHGIWENENRYLCPMNVRDNVLKDTALSLKTVQDALGRIRAKNICLILDCCQNEASTQGRSAAQTMTEGEEKSLDLLARDIVLNLKKKATTTIDSDYNPTVVVLNSCKKGERAFESVERRHGLFTAELLEAMEKRSKSTSELCQYVRDNVPKLLRTSGFHQTPYYTCAGGADIALPAVKKGYDVFLSYRRDGGSVLAKLIQTQLESRNLRVFLDIDESMAGCVFDQTLLARIEESTCFVPILSPGCFGRPDTMSDGDWVYKEMFHAIRNHKSIVPVFAPGFAWENQSVPERVEWLRKIDSIEYHSVYVNAFLDRLAVAVHQPGTLNHEAILKQMTAPYRAAAGEVPVSVKTQKTTELKEDNKVQQEATKHTAPTSLTVPTDVPTLAEACERIAPGGTIKVLRGKYYIPQAITITKNVTITGDVNHPEYVILQGGEENVFHIQSGFAEIAGLTIQNEGKQCPEDMPEEEKNAFATRYSALVVSAPLGVFHDCFFTSRYCCGFVANTKDSNPDVKNCAAQNCGLQGFYISSGACGTFRNCTASENDNAGIIVCDAQSNPTVEDCTFTDGKGIGIGVGSGASGMFQNCIASGNEFSGMVVYDPQSNPTVENCQFTDGKGLGIGICSGASGTFRNCTVSGNAIAGMAVQDDQSNPIVEDCIFTDGKQSGIFVNAGASGTFRNCIVSGNEYSGMMVSDTQSNPTVEDCTFEKNQGIGVWTGSGASGTFRNCTFSGNEFSGMMVSDAQSNPTVEDSKFTDGKQCGILVSSGAFGTFRNCTVSGNEFSGMMVSDAQSNPTVEDSKFTDGKQCGILVCDGACGTFRNCTVSGNEHSGMAVRNAQSNPTVEDCMFIDGKNAGILVYDGSSGTFRNCTVSGNENAGLEVRDAQSNPTVENCQFTDGKDIGIGVCSGASGTFRNCTFSGNEIAGMTVQDEQSNPTVEDCTFTDGKECGIVIYSGASGMFRNCTASGNEVAGIVVRDAQSNPTVEDCTFTDGKKDGILVCSGASGTFRNCTASGNENAGMQVRDEQSNPTVEDCMFEKNKGDGIVVSYGATGTFRRNIFSENVGQGKNVSCAAWNLVWECGESEQRQAREREEHEADEIRSSLMVWGIIAGTGIIIQGLVGAIPLGYTPLILLPIAGMVLCGLFFREANSILGLIAMILFLIIGWTLIVFMWWILLAVSGLCEIPQQFLLTIAATVVGVWVVWWCRK